MFYYTNSQLTKALFLTSSLHEKKKSPQGPLVIPALQNKDWRDLAKKRKNTGRYVPPSAAARVKVEVEAKDAEMEKPEEELKQEETEDQKALRALLSGTDVDAGGSFVDIIKPVTEDEAYKQDVEELPDEATLDDYARVPVAQFGAALLRGMGWEEGSAATRKHGKNGMVEPWVPTARPALLGIGAKERKVPDDGRSKKEKFEKTKRPERRYVPVIKKEIEGGRSVKQR
jgi:hypothetical protein